jgi:predicted NBD/HSP70 family sugar kinase
MGAQGELVFGSARGSEHFIYVQASHGVGAGLILNGQSYRGTVGISGEIGHIQLPGATGLCRCGNHGCLETVVSVREVARQLAQIGLAVSADDQHPSLSAMADDPTGRRVLTAAGRTLGRVLADVCNTLNPELLVIGGQLATGGAPVLQGVRESIDQYALPAISQATTVRSAQLGIRSEVMGAVARAIEQAHTLV